MQHVALLQGIDLFGIFEKLAFSSKLPLRRRIAQLGTFSVDPGILVSLYASTHHPNTTLATGE